MSTTHLPLTRTSIEHAHTVIAPLIHSTPLLTSSNLSLDASGGRNVLLFKPESLQRAGAFKIRGASYSLACLSEEQLAKGVCTHSSGNHASALAMAAKARGAKCYVVMPSNSAECKVASTRGYGAELVFCPPTLKDREKTLAEVQARTGATFIPPYDAANTILSQGTCFLEIEAQAAEQGYGKLGAVITPVGGGGLLAGTSLAAAGTGVRVFGSGLPKGEREVTVKANTIADGLRTPVGRINFPIIQKYVESVITVSEEEIIDAMHLLWERAKLVVEPSGAVAFAAARSEAFRALRALSRSS